MITDMDKIGVWVCNFSICHSLNYCKLKRYDIVTGFANSFEKSTASYQLINTRNLKIDQIKQFMDQRLALNDLSTVVQLSKLTHKDKIVNYLALIVKTSKDAEFFYTKSVVLLKNLKTLYVDGGKSSISIIISKYYKEQSNYKEQLLEIISELRSQIIELLKCFQNLQFPLIDMDNYLNLIYKPILEDTDLNKGNLESFWKWLFSSSTEIKTYEKNLALLSDLEKNRKEYLQNVTYAIHELNQTINNFESNTFNQVSAPMLSPEILDKRIKQIEKAVEKLEIKITRI